MDTPGELEALVAHVYVVGGRAVGSPPPGALAMPAPKRVTRVRQEETLFLLLVPSGAVKAQASVYQELAQQAADLYFKTAGGITGGLREMLVQLNQRILAEQKTLLQPLRVSLICAVMREHELYLARCGAMIAVFRHATQIMSFPANRTPENLNLVPPLGATMEPRIELTRYDLSPGCFLVLADSTFAKADDQEWQTILTSADDIGATLEPLRKLADSPLAHATVIQFVTEDTPTPEPPPIPTRPLSSPPALPVEAAESAEPPPIAVKEPLPEDAEPSPPRSKRASQEMKKVLAKTLSGVAETTSKVGDKIFAGESASEEDTTPENEQAAYPLLSNLVVLLALFIPLVVVVVVVGLALSDTGDTAFESCRLDVLARRDAARQLTPAEGAPITEESIARAREQWMLVKEEAFACEKEKPGDEEMRLIAGEAQNNLDRFDRVTRRDVVALRAFAPNADLRGPVSGNWITLYSLDRANDEVYQDVLNDKGTLLVSVGETPVIFKGQNIRGEVVDELIDLDWLERGGLPGGVSNVPIALDRTGLIVWYNETFGENDVLRLVTPATWSQPVALAVWRLNVYILDPAAQQIWRYVPNEGVYSELPEEYFFGENRPDLTGAVDLGIDEDGSVYVLFGSGTIRKFRGGVEQPFDLFNLPAGALTSAASLYVDNNPISRGLVVADPTNATLYTMSLGGTVNLGYRPLNQLDAFENIRGGIVNADLGNVYVLAGSYLYWMAR